MIKGVLDKVGIEAVIAGKASMDLKPLENVLLKTKE